MHMFLCILQMVNAMLNKRAFRGSRPAHDANRLLEGIKLENWSTRPHAARQLGAALADRGEIAYWVVAQEGGAGQNSRSGEQRSSARERIRLRSAKLLDAAYRFVCACRICDRSLYGLRLALARNIRLPRRLSVHIDETGEVRGVKVVWRHGLFMGVRVNQNDLGAALKPWDRYALRERYYGILD